MRLALEIPDTAPIAELNQQYLKEALVATLYHVGKLREACEALGMTRRAFQELLPRFGFSVLGDDPHTIKTELNA
jgi:hypothetical protein